MLRSSFIISRYWPNMGGSELHTRRLAHEIADRVDVDVVSHCSIEKILPEIAYAMNENKVINDKGVVNKQLSATGISRKLLRQLAVYYEKIRLARPVYRAVMRYSLSNTLTKHIQRSDVLHAVYNGSTATTQTAISVARKQDIPFVFTPLVHTTLPEGTAWSSRQFIKLYNKSDAILTMTTFEKQWLALRGVDEKRIHVCPMAPLLEGEADTERFRIKYGLGEHPFILFLGRLVDSKGYKVLLEAAGKIWKDYPDIHLVFAGPATTESVKIFSRIKDSRIHYAGSIVDEEKSSALAACHFLCVPSLEESLGVIYLEAWQFKKPVIAADIPVLRTVISDQVDGLLCQVNGDAVAQACLKLLNNPLTSIVMGQNGFHKVNKHYNWKNIGNQLLSVYQNLLY